MSEHPNGFIKIPNEIYDTALKYLKGAELSVYLAVARKTLGWHKTRDKIALSQIDDMLAISKRAIVRAILSLVENDWLICNHGKDHHAQNADRINSYQINTDHKYIKEMIKCYAKTAQPLCQNFIASQTVAISQSINGSYDKMAQQDVDSPTFSYDKMTHTKDRQKTKTKDNSRDAHSGNNDELLENGMSAAAFQELFQKRIYALNYQNEKHIQTLQELQTVSEDILKESIEYVENKRMPDGSRVADRFWLQDVYDYTQRPDYYRSKKNPVVAQKAAETDSRIDAIVDLINSFVDGTVDKHRAEQKPKVENLANNYQLEVIESQCKALANNGYSRVEFFAAVYETVTGGTE